MPWIELPWFYIHFSSYNGAQWCYVENNIGYGYSTCQDQRRSVKFPRETWSYSACATPALYSSSCRYCQGRRNSVNTSSSRGSGSRRPTIRGPDPKAEGVDTGSIQNNKPAPARPVTSRPRPYSTRPTTSRYQYRGRSNRYQYQGRIWIKTTLSHIKWLIALLSGLKLFVYF